MQYFCCRRTGTAMSLPACSWMIKEVVWSDGVCTFFTSGPAVQRELLGERHPGESGTWLNYCSSSLAIRRKLLGNRYVKTDNTRYDYACLHHDLDVLEYRHSKERLAQYATYQGGSTPRGRLTRCEL